MKLFVANVDLYIEAEDAEAAREKVRDAERGSLNYPTEFIKTVAGPERLGQDGARTPYHSPVKTKLGDRPALIVNDALVPEDAITGVRVHPAADDDPDGLEPAAIDIFTTGGIGFFAHGKSALALIEELGLQQLLAKITRSRQERHLDPS